MTGVSSQYVEPIAREITYIMSFRKAQSAYPESRKPKHHLDTG